MLFNHIVAICLLIAYLAPYISPERFWVLAFFGLTYPLWVLINLFFVIVWLILIPKRALYSLIILLSGWSLTSAFVRVKSDNTTAEDLKEPIKIMSYNVKLFDLYNWNHNTQTRNFFLLDKKAES